MSSAENGRLVWVSEEMQESLYRHAYHGMPIHHSAKELLRLFEAAPADPAEAIQRALLSDGRLGNIPPETVLRALGVPQRPTPRDEAPS